MDSKKTETNNTEIESKNTENRLVVAMWGVEGRKGDIGETGKIKFDNFIS